jgi:rhomboid family GlyGly-CTERM serine protease
MPPLLVGRDRWARRAIWSAEQDGPVGLTMARARSESRGSLLHRLALCHPLPRFVQGLTKRPELVLFAVLLAVFNWPVLRGSLSESMVFLPAAVEAGEWWRLFSHPWVHVTWYHLLLDGAAFLMLYHSLVEVSQLRRLSYVLAAGTGSLLISWLASPAISTVGLCGLSGIAHGLMAVSAVEMMTAGASDTMQRRLGWITLALVVGKAAIEAVTGRMFFTFLHFGLMGDPVAVSHAGGILGGLLAMLGLRRRKRAETRRIGFGTAQTVSCEMGPPL